MRKVWLVVKREYLTRVRTKAFIVATIGLPVFSIGVLVFSIYTAMRQTDHAVRIAIVDETGGLAGTVAKGLDAKLANGQPEFNLVKTIERPASEASAREVLLDEIQHGRLDAFLVIPKDAVASGTAELHTKNSGDFTLPAAMDRAMTDAVVARRLEDKGVRASDVGEIVRRVDVKLIKVTAQGETEEKGQTFVAAIVLGMLLYITLIVYGVSTMRSVMEEKSTRIVEVLVTSLKPFHLLAGKMLGVAGVAITQYLIWGVAAGLIAAYGGVMAAAVRPGASMPHFHFPVAWIVYLILFFVAGYLLYASLYAAIGAMVSTEQEAQQVQTPITLVIVVSFLLFNMILRDPNSTASVALSLVPFLSPILMILRIAAQTPPFWQIALALALSAATTAGVLAFSARIYRVGVLMYGKRPSLVELARWLKYT